MLFNLLKKNLLMFYSGIVPYFLSYILIIVVSTFKPIYGIFLSYGMIGMFFFSAYILDNISIEKQKKFLLVNYISSLIFGIIYFLSYKNILPLCNTSLKVLFFLIGTTLPTGTNHLLQIVKLYYVDLFSFIFNFFTGILWLVIGSILYFKKFLLDFSYIFFIIYLIFMIGLIYVIYSQNQIEDKKPLSIIDNYKLIIQDRNYWLVTIFFIGILNIQFYFLFKMTFNIYYHLFGGIIGCFFYYYILPKITMKEAFKWSLIFAMWMLLLPNPYASIFSGLVASSSFLSYIYVLDKYYYNMCKIFATWNILNFILKTATIIILTNYNIPSFILIKLYVFLLIVYSLVINFFYKNNS